jgi:hypothetical protein
MIVSDCPPCDVQHLTPIATVLLTCAFGVLGVAAAALGLKSWEYVLSIREKRLTILHEARKPNGS